MTLKAILKGKAPGFISVTSSTPISGVISVLAQKQIGAVLVVDEGKLNGILSERDIVRSLSTNAAKTLEMAARELMTSKVSTARSDVTVARAMEMMTDGHFRHLPIVDDGELIGLVSIGDVVKARIDQSQHEVDTLRTYVVGGV